MATEDTKELDKAIDTLHSLPEENKPKNFKDKDVPQLTEFFMTARKDLREKLPGCVFETNDNNQIGKDLTCVNCGKQVELKSGPDKTDANNGVGLLTKITGIDNLDEILSPQDRRGEHDEAKIKESKKKSMRELGKKTRQPFRKKQKENI